MHDHESGGIPGTPFMVPTSTALPLLVTGRGESSRQSTINQLAAIGCKYDRLAMRPTLCLMTRKLLRGGKLLCTQSRGVNFSLSPIAFKLASFMSSVNGLSSAPSKRECTKTKADGIPAGNDSLPRSFTFFPRGPMSARESEKDQKEYRYSWWEEVSLLPGMCEFEKAAWLFDLVLRLRPRHCLEVGVYGGRSLCAIAYGLQTNAFGRVTGIDTWASESTAEDTRYDTVNDPNWRQETLDACYFDLIHFFVAKGLVPFTRIVTGDSWLARYDLCQVLGAAHPH